MSLEAWGDDDGDDGRYTEERVQEIVEEETAELREKLATAEAELATARRDAQRLDWLQEQYTLHQGADIFYTVDGYAIELLTEDGNHVLHSWHGDTLRTAIDAALSTAGTTERGD